MVTFPHFSKQLNISRIKVIIRNDIILDANSRYRGFVLVPHWSVKSWEFKQPSSGFYAIYYLLWVFCFLLIMWPDQRVTIPKWGYHRVLTGSWLRCRIDLRTEITRNCSSDSEKCLYGINRIFLNILGVIILIMFFCKTTKMYSLSLSQKC